MNIRHFLQRKRLFATSFLLLGILPFCHAQLIEFGAGGGVFNYSGDLIRGYQVSNVRPAGSVFYRMNLSEIVSVRFSLTGGRIGGSDAVPIDPFGRERSAGFTSTVMELAGTFEYHFLDYKHENSLIKWSPYGFIGFGLFRLYGRDRRTVNYNIIQPTIPMGLGVKHLIGKRYSVGLELGARKTFFDQLDEISDGDQTVKDYQYGNPNDKDWYNYIGLSLSYIIWDIPCPFPYVPNQSIYR